MQIFFHIKHEITYGDSTQLRILENVWVLRRHTVLLFAMLQSRFTHLSLFSPDESDMFLLCLTPQNLGTVDVPTHYAAACTCWPLSLFNAQSPTFKTVQLSNTMKSATIAISKAAVTTAQERLTVLRFTLNACKPTCTFLCIAFQNFHHVTKIVRVDKHSRRIQPIASSG